MGYEVPTLNDNPAACMVLSTEMDLSLESSVTLARLADEVKNEDLTVGGRYDRTHNKHNR